MSELRKAEQKVAREADRLTALGYRRISNSKGIVARVDSPTWQQTVLEVNPVLLLSDQAEDFYRRNYSQDRLVVDQEVYKKIPGSTHNTTGYLDSNGRDIRMEVVLLREDQYVAESRPTVESVPIQTPLTLREKFIKWLASHGVIG